MKTFKPSALTLALVTAGLSSLSHAEEVEQTQLESSPTADAVEVIEVRGIRRSLATAQMEKMDNSSIVEAISAEDIGKLPDVSIAESLARLPGVQAQRLNGRANVIAIRGLGEDFNTTTLNGREQVTINNNRGVEFDQYPSELINGAVVYKTPDASVLTQAIGGTVDMQTIRPLAHGQQSITINARGEYNDLGKLNPDGEEYGYRTSVSYIDQFADDTIGVALGFAKMSSPNQEERWEAWGYPEVGDIDESIRQLGGAKPFVRSSELQRDAAMAVLEFAPNPNFTTVLDAFYSKFSDEQILRGIEIPGSWGEGWANDGLTITDVADGFVQSGVLENAKVLLRNDYNERDAEVYALGLNSQYQLNDAWQLALDLSHSYAERTDLGLESYAGTSRGNGCVEGGCEDLAFTMNGDRGVMFAPTLDYSDPDLIQLGGPFSWGNGVTIPSDAQDGFINIISTEDELSAIRLSAERLFADGHFSSLEVGGHYSVRQKSKRDKGTFLTLNDYPNGISIPDEFLLDPTDLSFIGFGEMISYDGYGLYQAGYYSEVDEGLTVAGRATNSWDVEEKITTFYSQLNLDTEVFERPLKGNLGVQVVRTEQSSNGFGVTADEDNEGQLVVVPTQGSSEFTEVLPSLNLALEIHDDHYLRFGAARSMARPRLDDMNASINFNFDVAKAGNTDVDNAAFSGNGGNVALEPTKSWSVDLGYEYYIGDQGYIATALYYKKLDDYIFNQSIVMDFSGVPASIEPATRLGLLSAPNNAEGGHIQGAEIATHLTGSLLSDSLAGFGIFASVSLNDGEIRETADSDPIDIPGMSKTAASATVYYEENGFQFRISGRYRDEFLGEVSGRSQARDERIVMAETVVDAQIGFDFSTLGIDGLSMLLQANNITDEPFRTYENGDERQIKDYQVYGTNYMVGVSYTF